MVNFAAPTAAVKPASPARSGGPAAEPNLDLNLLAVFDAVYRARSVSGAAQRLGQAQPTVSNALARLRRVTRDPLFVRTSRGMEPTPYAQRIAAPVEQALNSLNSALRAQARFDPQHDSRRFTLFMTDLGEAFFLPRLLAQLRTEAPGVQITTLPMPDTQPQVALESGAVDLALGRLPELPPGFYQQRLFREHYVCLARNDHPLAQPDGQMGPLSACWHAVVLPHGTGHSVVEQALGEQGLAQRIVLRVQNFLVLPAIVAQSDLLALLPRSAALQLLPASGVQLYPSPLALPDFTVTQCWHERFHHDAGNQWLRQKIYQLFCQP